MMERDEVETTILIFENELSDFEEYLDFVELSREIISEMDLDGTIQLATFHPEYVYQNKSYDDPQNSINRSPFPLIHLIREESISEVNVGRQLNSILSNNIENY